MNYTAKTKTWISLWIVYVIWGSTYLAIAVSVKSMPSLLAMGLRFISAAIILAIAILIRKGPREFQIPRREIINSGIFGAILLGVGIGALSLAEHTVPSGVVALIVSCLPLWVSLFRAISGDKPTKLTVLGIVIGFVGVAILIRPGQVTAVVGSNHHKLLLWMGVVLLGNFCWSLATFLAPKYPMPRNSFILTFYEMLFGGLILTIVGLMAGEKFSGFSHTTSAGLLAWLYLIFFGSIVGYSAFIWLVTNAPVSLTSTYAYVNPVVAVFLGTIFLKEKFHAMELVGGVIVLLGVILVVNAESRRRILKAKV